MFLEIYNWILRKFKLQNAILPEIFWPEGPETVQMKSYREAKIYFKEWLKSAGCDDWLAGQMTEALAKYACKRVEEYNISTLEAVVEVRTEISRIFEAEVNAIAVFSVAVRTGFVFEEIEDTCYFLGQVRERLFNPITASSGLMGEERVVGQSIKLMNKMHDLLDSRDCDWCVQYQRSVVIATSALWLVEDPGQATHAEFALALNVAIEATLQTIHLDQLRNFLKQHGYGELDKLFYLMKRGLVTRNVIDAFIRFPECFSGVGTARLVLSLQGLSSQERNRFLQESTQAVRRNETDSTQS